MAFRKALLPLHSPSREAKKPDDIKSFFPDYKRNLLDEMEEAKSCKEKFLDRFPALKLTKEKVAAGAITAVAVVSDSQLVRYGIDDMDRPILGFIQRTEADKNLIQGMYVLAQASANFDSIKESLKKSFTILYRRELPSDWEPLHRRKEIAAGVIGSLFVAYATTATVSAQRQYMLDEEYSEATANSVAAVYTIYYLFTSGRTTWESIRRWFYDKVPHSQHRLLSRIIGGFLAVFNAFGASLQGFMGITVGLKITNTGAQIVFLSLSFMAGYCDVTYTIGLNQHALDDLYEKIEARDVEPHEVFALILSSSFGAVIIDTLAQGYLDTILTAALPFTLPIEVYMVLSYAVAIGDGITLTWGLTSITTPLTKGIGNLLGKLYDAVPSCRKSETTEEKEDKKFNQMEMGEQKSPDVKKSPSVATNTSTLFVRRPESEERIENVKQTLLGEETSQKSSWCSSCAIM
jgi:hypothetical protein